MLGITTLVMIIFLVFDFKQAVCVANIDTLSAALTLGDAAALNFANAVTPGGRYRSHGTFRRD